MVLPCSAEPTQPTIGMQPEMANFAVYLNKSLPVRQTSQYAKCIAKLMEAYPQWSTINGACRAGASITVGV